MLPDRMIYNKLCSKEMWYLQNDRHIDLKQILEIDPNKYGQLIFDESL